MNSVFVIYIWVHTVYYNLNINERENTISHIMYSGLRRSIRSITAQIMLCKTTSFVQNKNCCFLSISMYKFQHLTPPLFHCPYSQFPKHMYIYAEYKIEKIMQELRNGAHVLDKVVQIQWFQLCGQHLTVTPLGAKK